MDEYKKKIYNNYITNHTKNLYGDNSLPRIKARFPVLRYYYARHIPQDKNLRILDIGCGDGSFVCCLQEMGYQNVHGIDISSEQIEKGRKMGIQNLECGDFITYLSDNNNKFDVIIAIDIIEHFKRNEVFDILELINKNLNDGGRLIMQVPNGQGLFYSCIFYGDYTHEMAYTANSINQIILNTGFKKAICFPQGPVPHGIVSIIRYLLWELKVSSLKFWKMVETGTSKGIFTQNIIAVIEK